MPRYYRRTKNLYKPGSEEPFKLSRSKIDLFHECPRCFYLDRRLGVVRPDMPAFTLNVAVDHLLKKEFDAHRAAGTPHPFMTTYKVDAIPFSHQEIDTWRENFVGVQCVHTDTNFLVTGAVDDVWKDSKGNLIVVDYKATSKAEGVKELDDTKWHNQYRRQMEVYQWLLRQKGFPVSDTGYFVYVNGRKDKEAFDGKLEFDVALISYEGKTDWIPKTLSAIKKCLEDDRIPKADADCDFCNYVAARNDAAGEQKSKKKETPIKKKSADTLFGDL